MSLLSSTPINSTNCLSMKVLAQTQHGGLKLISPQTLCFGIRFFHPSHWMAKPSIKMSKKTGRQNLDLFSFKVQIKYVINVCGFNLLNISQICLPSPSPCPLDYVTTSQVFFLNSVPISSSPFSTLPNVRSKMFFLFNFAT